MIILRVRIGEFTVRNKRDLGNVGEKQAAQLLISSGLQISALNYRCPKGEMDIIARDGKDLVFVEVRTRRSPRWGWGEESIRPDKAKRLQAIAAYYVKQQGYTFWPSMRFDVIAIRWLEEGPELKWIQAAL
jgi:putative endonuclease